jgi:5'-nucleotidase
MNRRRFVRVASAGAAGGLLLPDWVGGSTAGGPEVGIPGTSADGVEQALHLVILHTNDTHSRLDPFPLDGGPFQGLGGVARRATLIRRIRERHPNVLLLDSGDIFQGTPYFNFFGGEIELEAMSAMGYDVATIGNHDFDNGTRGLAAVMPRAAFPFVSANYEVAGSALEPWIRPWTVRERGGIRVGIFGLGVAFEGLVLEQMHEGVRYTDPFAAARRCVSELRGQDCSLVICLSHLGYRYRGARASDTELAQEIEGIDLILGGHTHTFLDEPDVITHASGRKTLVNQVGWGGIRLGRVDVLLSPAPRGEGDPDVPLPLEWAARGYLVDASLD